jgi:hypothetical protein
MCYRNEGRKKAAVQNGWMKLECLQCDQIGRPTPKNIAQMSIFSGVGRIFSKKCRPMIDAQFFPQNRPKFTKKALDLGYFC